MTTDQPQFELFNFAPVEDGARVGFPAAAPGDQFVAFRVYGVPSFGEGGKITAIVEDDTSQMLAQGALNLGGGFGSPFEVFKAVRQGWPEDWADPADARQWIIPAAGSGF